MFGPSRGIIEFVETIEGFRSFAYPDPKTGGEPWTVGYGSTTIKGVRVRPFQRVTIEDAHDEVVSRLADLAQRIYAKLPETRADELTQGRLDALVSILDNVGPGSIGRSGIFRLKDGKYSRLWRRVLSGEWHEAGDEFQKWVSPGTAVEKGLRKRRVAELLIWDGADPMEAYSEVCGADGAI